MLGRIIRGNDGSVPHVEHFKVFSLPKGCVCVAFHGYYLEHLQICRPQGADLKVLQIFRHSEYQRYVTGNMRTLQIMLQLSLCAACYLFTDNLLDTLRNGSLELVGWVVPGIGWDVTK
jgi:hypothetical protein